ncbi:hypothetical protein B0H19DRAFT_426706 [Mycena capillaripes]|nr:hypothetical protein B0H19DRAFT_426706 [Mycena capillaripes]
MEQLFLFHPPISHHIKTKPELYMTTQLIQVIQMSYHSPRAKYLILLTKAANGGRLKRRTEPLALCHPTILNIYRIGPAVQTPRPPFRTILHFLKVQIVIYIEPKLYMPTQLIQVIQMSYHSRRAKYLILLTKTANGGRLKRRTEPLALCHPTILNIYRIAPAVQTPRFPFWTILHFLKVQIFIYIEPELCMPTQLIQVIQMIYHSRRAKYLILLTESANDGKLKRQMEQLVLCHPIFSSLYNRPTTHQRIIYHLQIHFSTKSQQSGLQGFHFGKYYTFQRCEGGSK